MKSFHFVLEESEVSKSASLKSCSHQSRRIGALSTSLEAWKSNQRSSIFSSVLSIYICPFPPRFRPAYSAYLRKLKTEKLLIQKSLFIWLSNQVIPICNDEVTSIFPELVQDCNYCSSCSVCASQSPDPNVRVAYIRLHHKGYKTNQKVPTSIFTRRKDDGDE